MREETQENIRMAIDGLMSAADGIDMALLGKKRHLNARKCERHGPFAQKLYSIAEIADGGPIPDVGKARIDMLFLFDLLHHLHDLYYASLWDILARAHEILVDDLMTEKEARELLGGQHRLDEDKQLGYIHPLVEYEGRFRTSQRWSSCDPIGDIRYARYEIEAQKHRHDQLVAIYANVEWWRDRIRAAITYDDLW